MPGTKSTEDLPPTLPLFRNKSMVMPDPESFGSMSPVLAFIKDIEGFLHDRP